MNVNVLGTEYTIVFESLVENNKLEQCDGYCDWHMKKIHVRKHIHEDKDRDNMTISDDAMKLHENRCLRHELIHAFLYESGLAYDSNHSTQWAVNEEMVDWIAIQMPKIMKAYESVVKPNETIEETSNRNRKLERIVIRWQLLTIALSSKQKSYGYKAKSIKKYQR